MTAVLPIRADSNRIEDLIDQLIHVKHREDAANRERVELEQRIAALLPPPQEGSHTTAVGSYKVTITGRLIYKADIGELERLAAQLPANLRPLRTETKADETGLKYLRNNEPELWALIAPAIEIKPAKVAIKVGV